MSNSHEQLNQLLVGLTREAYKDDVELGSIKEPVGASFDSSGGAAGPIKRRSARSWKSYFYFGRDGATYLPLSPTLATSTILKDSSSGWPLIITVVVGAVGISVIVLAMIRQLYYPLLAFSSLPHEKSLSECSPQDWSSGTWELKSPLPGPNDSVLSISGFEGCSSQFAYKWHLGLVNHSIGSYRRDASNYVYVPGKNCSKGDFNREELVTSLVERGGWLLIGDSLSEEQFFSLSCLLYPHIRASPDASGWGRTKDYLGSRQDLYLSADSSLIPTLNFPVGFNITATPLVTFQRVDLLFNHEELHTIYTSLPPFSPTTPDVSQNQSAIFGSEAFWDVPSAQYFSLFTAPFPLNYRLLFISTAGHWTTSTFSLQGGMKEVLYLFKASMDKWMTLAQTALELGGAGKEIVVRAYLGGHEKYFETKSPVQSVLAYSPETPFNWREIYQFNIIFETAIKAASNSRITFIDIIRPAQLRPDSHTYWDCLHHAIGSGVIEGWNDYLAFYMKG